MYEALSAMAAFVVFLLILPWIPNAIKALSNEPNRYKPDRISFGKEPTIYDYKISKHGFFTFLQPGRAKIVERGQRFIRAIMAFDEHTFEGEKPTNDLVPEHEDYWEVVESGAYPDYHPIPFPIRKWSDFERNPWWAFYFLISSLWWLWKRYVYKITGGIFTGIPPFQNVRTYPLERFKEVADGTGKITLERFHDYSDHFRVADFQYPVIVPQTDTKDKIPVTVNLNEVARVSNPYKLAYYSDDDWLPRFGASIANAVTTITRANVLDDVLTARDGTAAETFGLSVTSLTQVAVKRIGIHVELTQVRDIRATVIEEPDIRALGNLARAKIQRQADEELAKGKAAYVREEGQALQDHPNSEIVVQSEALVRAAEAAGKNGGTVILGGGAIDPMQAAILNALKGGRG